MTCFAEATPKGRALIPNVMQPSPRNNIKRIEIDNKRVIHTLIMKKKINNNPLLWRKLLTYCIVYPRQDNIQCFLK